MKKIECHISDESSERIDEICTKECYTRAEYNRKALEFYLWVCKEGFDYYPKEQIFKKRVSA